MEIQTGAWIGDRTATTRFQPRDRERAEETLTEEALLTKLSRGSAGRKGEAEVGAEAAKHPGMVVSRLGVPRNIDAVVGIRGGHGQDTAAPAFLHGNEGVSGVDHREGSLQKAKWRAEEVGD